MQKLSDKSIKKIELFLYMKDMNYISLSRHDMKLLYRIYNIFIVETLELEQENQELKKQLENCYCNRTDCSSRIKNSKKYDSLVQKVESQQKEFIMWLENEINRLDDYCNDEQSLLYSKALYELQKTKEILAKYKKIVGVKDEN